MMSVLACGLNTSGQILKDGPGILCCPSQVYFPSNITAASVAFSHIIWRTASGWQLTGHDIEDPKRRLSLKASWEVCGCENRIAAINDDGSVLVWEKQWKTLHFQKRNPHNETSSEHLTKDNHSTNYREKESTNVDISANFHLKRTEYESSKKSDFENSFDNRVHNDRIFEWQENMNKRRKLETLTNREDKCPVSKNLCPERTKVTFVKVAVEDNALLALDSDGVMYCGSVPVPLRMKVKDVAVGKEHSMALTALGDIITWGSGMRGQLGIGELCQSEKPVPVESLQGVPITTIDCGAWHCTALSLSGDLYVWGWNESGQLGFPYRCEGNQSLFNFFEHSCQCPKGDEFKPDTDIEREPLQRHHSHVESKGKEEESHGERGESKGLGNTEENDREKREMRIREQDKTEESFEEEREIRMKRQDNIEENFEGREVRKKEGDQTEEREEVKKREENKTEENDEERREGKNKQMYETKVNPERRQEFINVQASPVLMDFWTEDVNVTNVQCGDRHTLYMLDDGSVWSAGMNRYGQLGLGHVRAVKEPCRVFRRGISDMCAGGWNSVFLTNTRHSTS